MDDDIDIAPYGMSALVLECLEAERQRIDSLLALLSADNRAVGTVLINDTKRLKELAKRQRRRMMVMRTDGITKR